MTQKTIAVGIVGLLVVGGLVGLLSMMPDEVVAPGPTYVGFVISTDTTWTADNSPYIIIDDLLVEKNVTLTIEPGVEVRFGDFYYIQIEGVLIAEGTENNMINFTSNNTSPAPGDWDSIKIMNNADNGSSIKYCRIEYGHDAIHVYDANPYAILNITNNIITNSSDNGIIFHPFSGVISTIDPLNRIMFNTITNNAGRGIWIHHYIRSENSKLIVSNNSIFNNNYGIMGSAYTGALYFNNNTILRNDLWGIRVGSVDNYEIKKNLIMYNHYGGIEANGDEESIIIIENNSIAYNGYPGSSKAGLLISIQNSANNASFHYNNFFNNTPHDVRNNWEPDINATFNWWGTTNTDLINQSIFDYWDDFNKGEVIYLPFLGGPSPGAPEIPIVENGGLQPGAPWPMFRGNVRHTGLSPYNTSENTGELNWSFETNGAVQSSPGIDSNNTIYVGSKDNKLYAINSNGTEKWSFITGGEVLSSPAIGLDGTIYVGSQDYKLYAINQNGTEKWSFTTGHVVDSSPAIGSDGTIYVGSFDNKLYAINPNGTEKWGFGTSDDVRSSPAIGFDGTIYVGSLDNKLYAINPNGTMKWDFITGDDITTSPAIGPDGTIYIGSWDKKLYAIYPNGSEKWSFMMQALLVTSSPAIGPNGTIYIGSTDNKLYSFNPNGTEKWNFTTGGWIVSSPVIGIDGAIYIGSFDHKLYAINPNGIEKWNYTTGDDVASSPAIGSDGTIYIGSYDNYLYAIGDAPNQPPLTPSTPSGPTSGFNDTSYFFSTSTTDPDGDQIKYGWDWDGDGTVDEWSSFVDSGTEDNRSHSWSSPGFYSIKVKAQDELDEESGWSDVLNITITSPPDTQSPVINGIIPEIELNEDFTAYEINLTPYPSDLQDSVSELRWYLTGVDRSIISVEGENETGNHFITITSIDEMFGEMKVFYHLVDSDDNTAIQAAWINISSVNDAPQISGAPNLSVQHNHAVTVDYSQYILDPDTPLHQLTLTTSEPTVDSGNGYAAVDGLNVTYFYPESRVGESFFVEITASDGEEGLPYSLEITVVDEEPDFDDDGIPDSEDPDDDNDGHNDEDDYYPLDPTRWSPLDEIYILNITLSNEAPVEGDEITITIEIQNTDISDIDLVIKFYDGDPDLDGTQIGSDHEVKVSTDSPLTVSQNWIAISGNHTLYVVIGHNSTTDTLATYISIEVSQDVVPVLVLSLGDINIYRFEPGEVRTINVEVTCYHETVDNVHLVVLDHQNLTIDTTITPSRTMNDGETLKFYLRITAPELPEGTSKLERDITIQAVGDNGIYSNAEELDIVVSESALSFLDPLYIAGGIVTASVASLGAAAVASRRNENWKYLLLLTFAVPLYTRIKGKKTLDNFVRGQVFGHIQSQPGTHFNEIKKTLQLGNGNLAYHLRKLEKEGFIKSKRDRRYRRFYPIGVEVPEENGIILSKTQDNILDFIEQHPKATQKEIASTTKESQQTVSYNLNVLVREGFITEEKFKGTKRYEIKEDNT